MFPPILNAWCCCSGGGGGGGGGGGRCGGDSYRGTPVHPEAPTKWLSIALSQAATYSP